MTRKSCKGFLKDNAIIVVAFNKAIFFMSYEKEDWVPGMTRWQEKAPHSRQKKHHHKQHGHNQGTPESRNRKRQQEAGQVATKISR